MKQLRLLVIALTFAGAAVPAHAAIIGLAGGDVDPQSIFDPAEQALVAGCLFVPTDRFCAQYTILPDPEDEGSEVDPGPPNFILHSIDFRLRKESGEFFTTEHVGDCEISLCVDPVFSDLDFLIASPLFDDGITFRLFDFTIYCFPGVPDCDAEFFSSDPSPGVSVVGVNGVSSVAEPATLLLMGPVVAALVRRRRRSARMSTAAGVTTSDGTSLRPR